jgi:hypothetical protein
MSDILKAQATPQFNWYTCWTLLGANGMLDKLIKKGLKQTNWIKVSFEKGQKEHTGHVAPDRDLDPIIYLYLHFMTLSQRSSLNFLRPTRDSPTLFSLMGQCFEDVSLTKWTNIVCKWCPNKMHLVKENSDDYIRDYLKAVAGFLNIGNQLICWLCVAKKPKFMLMHEFMRRWVQLFSYLDSRLLRWRMELPTAQEKAKQIFLTKPKAHQFNFAETNKMAPMDPLWLVAFLEQCQTANKAAGVLDKLKEKKQQYEKKKAHLPVACSCGSNHRHHCCKNHDHHQSNQCDYNKCQHDSCPCNDQCNDHPHCKVKELQVWEKRILQTRFFLNKEEVTHNKNSSSLSADTLSGKKSCSMSRPPLH